MVRAAEEGPGRPLRERSGADTGPPSTPPEVSVGTPMVGDDSRIPYTVRVARPRDAAAFVELFQAVIAERRFVRSDTVHRTVGYFRRQFRRPWTGEQVSLVATAGPRLVGHLHAAREDNPESRHVASLGMAVARDWRGRGVGSALMAECVRWGHEVGVEKLALSVYPDNDAARALYRKYGFVEEGRLSGHSKKRVGYRDEIVMGLWLIDPPGSTAPPPSP